MADDVQVGQLPPRESLTGTSFVALAVFEASDGAVFDPAAGDRGREDGVFQVVTRMARSMAPMNESGATRNPTRSPVATPLDRPET